MSLMMAYDTETTGLIENMMTRADLQPEVIEFYGVQFDIDSGELFEECHFLIQPKKLPLPPKIIQITGIEDKDVVDAPFFADLAEKIISFIERQPIVVAHNLSFDMDMINLEAKKIDRQVAWPAVLCTVEQTLHIKGFRLTLSDLHELLFGERFSGAHRAKHDVMALVRCCIELRKRGDL